MPISGKNLRGYLAKKKKYAPTEHRQYYNDCIFKVIITKNYYNYIKSLKKDIKKTYKRINRNGRFALATLNGKITRFFYDPNDLAYNNRQRHATDGLFIELYKKYYGC